MFLKYLDNLKYKKNFVLLNNNVIINYKLEVEILPNIFYKLLNFKKIENL